MGGDFIPQTPRCGAPLRFVNVNEPRTDLHPVCWRPKGHSSPRRHLSEYAWRRKLAANRARGGR